MDSIVSRFVIKTRETGVPWHLVINNLKVFKGGACLGISNLTQERQSQAGGTDQEWWLSSRTCFLAASFR